MKLQLPRARLRTKIFAWTFIPTAIIMLLVALTLYMAYQQVTEQVMIEGNREATRLRAAELSASLEDYIDRLAALARSPRVTSGDPKTQRIELNEAKNQIVFFDGGVYILNNIGRVVATYPFPLGLVGQDWSNYPFFTAMARSPGLFFSDLGSFGIDGDPRIAIAVPIIDEQAEFEGVVVGMFRLSGNQASTLYGMILKLRLGRNGNAYVIDGNNRLIYASDWHAEGEEFTDHPLFPAGSSGQVEAIRTRSRSGQDVVAGHAPVPRTNWTLIVEEDWNRLVQASLGYRQFLVLLLILGAVIPTIVVMYGVRRITSPIEDFRTAAQRIAGGDFDQRINVHTADEMEDLADQFNAMASQLKDSYETLEMRVEQRTQELTALNSISAVVSRSLDLNQISMDALSKTIEVMGMEGGAVFRLDPENMTLILLAQKGLGEKLLAATRELTLEQSVIREIYETRRPISRRISEYPSGPVREALEGEGWQTVVSIPLMIQDTVLGGINVISRSQKQLTEEQLEVPSAIGQQIGVAMENARLYDQSLEYARQMELARQSAEAARAAAEAANAAKTDFLANVSHELRTPLVSINGFARIVRKRLEERIFPLVKAPDDRTQKAIDQVGENLDIIVDEGQRLTSMINNLLDLEKIEAGKMEWKIQVVLMGEVVQRAVQATAALFEGKSTWLVVDLPPKIPAVRGDEEKLLQVMINLISNAVKFTQEGPITVRARSEKTEVVISVIDQGIGIDPAKHELIFEKFRQLGDPLTGKPKGSGLGLAISKEIVDHHGGRIWFESQPGKGTTFSFSVPVVPGTAEKKTGNKHPEKV